MNKVNKKVARKAYNEGKTVLMIRNKMNPFNPYWNMSAEISKKRFGDRDFDSLVNEYRYYNCNYETGYYPAYYISG